MVALEWERKETLRYVVNHIRPAIKALGIPFTFASRKKYATKDFFGGISGTSPLIPAFTNQSGEPSKLSEFCSGEWKRDVTTRWAAEQAGFKERGVDNWIGISWEERHRRRASRSQWFQVAYPLLDMMPKAMHVSACLAAVERVGWPVPPRSRCFHCPNQSDAEWGDLTPEEWEMACQRDEWIRTVDPNAFLHKQLIPLRQVVLDPKEDNGGLFGGCQAGMCY